MADAGIRFRGQDDERFARAYNGSLGAWKPSADSTQGQSPWSGGQRAKPLELKDIYFFDAKGAINLACMMHR